MDEIYTFSKAEIEEYLVMVKECLKNKKYQISKNGNRIKNVNFMMRNNITDEKAHEILNNLTIDDYCYAMKNDNPDPKYSREILHLFCKEIEHNVRGTLKHLDIFIKINIAECSGSDEYMFIVSFHNFDRDNNGEIPYKRW